MSKKSPESMTDDGYNKGIDAILDQQSNTTLKFQCYVMQAKCLQSERASFCTIMH